MRLGYSAPLLLHLHVSLCTTCLLQQELAEKEKKHKEKMEAHQYVTIKVRAAKQVLGRSPCLCQNRLPAFLFPIWPNKV